jgi:hypothetical protein
VRALSRRSGPTTPLLALYLLADEPLPQRLREMVVAELAAFAPVRAGGKRSPECLQW